MHEGNKKGVKAQTAADQSLILATIVKTKNYGQNAIIRAWLTEHSWSTTNMKDCYVELLTVLYTHLNRQLMNQVYHILIPGNNIACSMQLTNGNRRSNMQLLKRNNKINKIQQDHNQLRPVPFKTNEVTIKASRSTSHVISQHQHDRNQDWYP